MVGPAADHFSLHELPSSSTPSSHDFVGSPSTTAEMRQRDVPFLAFLATGQHGAAELRVGPDGRLSGRATVAEATARGRTT
eukprot:scaffold3795_cov126-Isochrysis_galbana.AAC.3